MRFECTECSGASPEVFCQWCFGCEDCCECGTDEYHIRTYPDNHANWDTEMGDF